MCRLIYASFRSLLNCTAESHKHSSFSACRMRNIRWKAFNHIPEEILIGILVRLPVKSLLRFLCVCKLWSNLIGSSSFIGTHLNSNVTKHANIFLIALHCMRGKRKICHSLFSNETFKECLEIGHPLGIKKRFQVHGSSNGLICLTDQPLRYHSPIFICNPSIRKLVSLPKATIPFRILARIDNVLAFGFHPGLNDYKVVRMVDFTNYKKSCVEVEVYSLSTNSWKRIRAIPDPIKTMWWHSGSAYFNGVAYWIMSKYKRYHLVSFDTGTEVFQELILPDDAISGHYPSINRYKGSICLLTKHEIDKHIDIWVLQEESFKKLHTIVLPGTNPAPLSFRINNELLIQYREIHCEGADLALYNPDREQVIDTGIRLWQTCDSRYYADTYIESLVLLDA